ncbi:hypothetical protein [Pseudonocardia sp. HH130630-07]|uniref:hypothetical protein n=1 Tax=Pseudonocardia sp. HH130630-07 TaxID=1690815 RepID=UPI0008152055|nr:hypothetical protein [Pseudonocardia sp. HH130630-07]ANY07611.1 hypothetical protein AFB00_16380 [Pseudonocardia sp. HH130630-07]
MEWSGYPRDQLIEDVVMLLTARGVDVVLPPERRAERQDAASRLLAAMSVIPTLAPEDALDLDGHARYQRAVHGD